MNPDLTDEEHAALVRLVKRAIDTDGYPLSPRLDPLKAILAKLSPQPAREPLPPPKVYAPPKPRLAEDGAPAANGPPAKTGEIRA
jgi:hypothetical protein